MEFLKILRQRFLALEEPLEFSKSEISKELNLYYIQLSTLYRKLKFSVQPEGENWWCDFRLCEVACIRGEGVTETPQGRVF